MPRHLRVEFSGAKYHITSRGNGRDIIFYAEDDRERFVEQLRQALEKEQVVLYAYSMLPNHYHLLLETPRRNLHGFMQRLNTAYGMYFRYKRRRPGHCFQGRYGARLVGGDDYILRLVRYIHLNPVKTEEMAHKSVAEKRDLLKNYPWSSFRGYVSPKHTEEFVNYRWLDLISSGSLSAKRRAYAWYTDQFIDNIDTVMLATYGKSEYAIGDDDFVDEVENNILRKKKKDVRMADVRWPEDKNIITLKVVFEAVATEYGIAIPALSAHGRVAGEAKGMFIETACRACGLTQRALADVLGTSEHAIGKQRMRFWQRLECEPELHCRMCRILDRICVG